MKKHNNEKKIQNKEMLLIRNPRFTVINCTFEFE